MHNFKLSRSEWRENRFPYYRNYSHADLRVSVINIHRRFMHALMGELSSESVMSAVFHKELIDICLKNLTVYS